MWNKRMCCYFFFCFFSLPILFAYTSHLCPTCVYITITFWGDSVRVVFIFSHSFNFTSHLLYLSLLPAVLLVSLFGFWSVKIFHRANFMIFWLFGFITFLKPWNRKKHWNTNKVIMIGNTIRNCVYIHWK